MQRALTFDQFRTGYYTNQPIIGSGLASGPEFLTTNSVNVEHTSRLSVKRRPGFSKWTIVALSAGQAPLNGQTVIINGSPVLLLDDYVSIWQYTPTSRSLIYTKNASAAMAYAPVGEAVYVANGSPLDLKKRIGNNNFKDWGLTAPANPPTVAIGPAGPPNNIRARIGYRYTYVHKDSTDGHCSSAPLVSADTGNFGTLRQYLLVNGAYSGQSRPDTIEVYRTKDGGSTLFKVTSAPFNNVIPAACTAALVATGTGNCTNGTHSYRYSYVNVDGLETQAAAKSNVVTVDGTHKQVNLTGITVGPTGTTKRNIYRTAAGDTGNWFFIGSVNDNTTTIFTDNVADGGAAALFASTSGWQLSDVMADNNLNVQIIAPLSNVNDPPPSTLTNVIYHNGRLWASVGNVLYFSSGSDAFNGVGEECWPPLNNFKLTSPISAFASTSQGLTVFTQTGDWYLITGSSLQDFQLTKLRGRVPIYAQNHLDTDGDIIYAFTMGRQVLRITDSLEDIGFPIQPDLDAISDTTAFGPQVVAAVSGVRLTFHRAGPNSALYLSTNVPDTRIYQFSLSTETWSPKWQPSWANGVGFLKSIQTDVVTFPLLVSVAGVTSTGNIFMLDRTTFIDDTTPYDAKVILGPLVLADQGSTPMAVEAIALQCQASSDPIVSVAVQAADNAGANRFDSIPAAKDHPLYTNDSDNYRSRLYYLKAGTPTNAGVSQVVRNCVVSIDFGTVSSNDELMSLSILASDFAVQ